MDGSSGLHLLVSSFLLCSFFFSLNSVHATTRKCYNVYLGAHSHGPTPSSYDLEVATYSHYDLLTPILGSVLSDGVSVESGNQRRKGGGGGSGRDWWWKQDNGGGSESGRVKDYVMEWIGSEIKERPKTEWVASPSSNGFDAENLDRDSYNNNSNSNQKNKNKKKQRKRLDWWASLDEEKVNHHHHQQQQKKNTEKNRKPRKWWKEEFCDELAKKSKKKKRSLDGVVGNESWWQKDEDLVQDQKRKRKCKSSRGSIDWWLDGLSGIYIVVYKLF